MRTFAKATGSQPVPKSEPPASALARLHQDFAEAAGATGVSELRVAVAGKAVSIRFAGAEAAEALGAAFAHLETRASDDPPALTIEVWDSAAAATARPAFAPPKSEGEAESAGVGPSFLYETRGFRALHQPSTDILSVFSAATKSAWFWAPDLTALPYWEYAAPFRHLLSWALEEWNCRQIHAGAVGTLDGGMLLVGRGGSGKSTTALAALLDERLHYAGDDYVAVAWGGEPTIHSLYCLAKLHRADLGRLAQLGADFGSKTRPDEKVMIDVAAAFPARVSCGFPLRAIVLPRVTRRRTARAVPTTPGAALAALAPSTIFQLHPPDPEAVAQMAVIVRAVPAFVLELGTDVETIPDELVRILEKAR